MEVMAGDTGAPGFIPLYDDTTSFAPIQNPFNGISSALNNALKSAAFNFFPNLATLNLPANAGTTVNQKATVNADSTSTNNGDYFWSGTAWVPYRLRGLTPRLLGETSVPQASQTLLTTSMGDVSGATVTATSSGSLVRVTVSGSYNNAGSGAARSAQLQILCDGTLVGEVFPGSGQTFIGFISGNNGTPFTHKARHTPTAGSHTWKLQALASASSAVYCAQAVITVEEFV